MGRLDEGYWSGRGGVGEAEVGKKVGKGVKKSIFLAC